MPVDTKTRATALQNVRRQLFNVLRPCIENLGPKDIEISVDCDQSGKEMVIISFPNDELSDEMLNSIRKGLAQHTATDCGLKVNENDALSNYSISYMATPEQLNAQTMASGNQQAITKCIKNHMLSSPRK